MLEITRRNSLPTVALSGPAVSPVQQISDRSVARALSQPGGIVVLIEPDSPDAVGLQELGRALKAGPHFPTVLVVARKFNPFAFSGAFQGIAVAHLKGRANVFFRDLPMPPSAGDLPEIALPKKDKKKSGPQAPHLQMVGREDELAALKEVLGTGGPVVVSGPSGIGKRWLVETAIADAGLKRLPELTLGWGCEHDTLLAHIAAIGEEHGAPQLGALLRKPHKPSEAVAAAIETLQAATATEGMAMIVHDLQWATGRDGSFFRKSRLEMLVEALLTATYPLRLVFTSRVQPVFFTEGAAAGLRRMELGGIMGRFLHEIFEGLRVPEFPREKFGPMNDKIHGNPLAIRTYAVATRRRGPELADDAKYMKMESAADTDKLRKAIGKEVDRVKGDARNALSLLAHLRTPALGSEIAELGIGRKGRIQLLSDGLLDMIPTADGRAYAVHPLVRSCLSFREVSDFDVHGRLSHFYGKAARDAEGVKGVALMYEANRQAIAGRKWRNRIGTPFPSFDGDRDSVLGLLRGKKPNFSLAAQKIGEVLNQVPGNADFWLLKAELMRRDNAKPEKLVEHYTAAFEAAPVPELFHDAAGFWLSRRQRKKAVGVLEKGVEALPDQPRLKTRLAALLLKEGRRNEAIELLKTAMNQAPMLPDAYGILGMAKRAEGAEALEEAEQLLREAVRLAPDDAVQVSRLADLLAHKARTTGGAEGEAMRAEARELLDNALRGEARAPEAHLLLAQLIREDGGDLERAIWLLKKVKKNSDRSPERKTRIALEFALIDIARNELDSAERSVRGLSEKDPSNHRVFAVLSRILEARQQLIPAHAELMRAKERAPLGSLDQQRYEGDLTRLQTMIEAGVHLLPDPVNAPAESSLPQLESVAPRVIRRKKDGDVEAALAAPEGDEAAAAEEEAAPAEEDAAAAPAEEAAPAKEAEAADEEPKAEIAR